MTREELLENRRAGFEEWVKDNWDNSDIRLLRDPDDRDYYKFVPTQRAWGTWNAALDSVVIELPSALQIDDQWDSCKVGFNQCVEECCELIQSQGYKVKP